MRTSWSLLPRSRVISCRTAVGDLSNHRESLHGSCSKPIGYRKRSGSGLIIIELAARTVATSPHTVGPIPQMRSSTHFKSGKLSRPTSPMNKILVSPSLFTLSITLGLNPQAPVAPILVGRSHGRLIIWPPLIGTADTSIVNQPGGWPGGCRLTTTMCPQSAARQRNGGQREYVGRSRGWNGRRESWAFEILPAREKELCMRQALENTMAALKRRKQRTEYIEMRKQSMLRYQHIAYIAPTLTLQDTCGLCRGGRHLPKADSCTFAQS